MCGRRRELLHGVWRSKEAETNNKGGAQWKEKFFGDGGGLEAFVLGLRGVKEKWIVE